MHSSRSIEGALEAALEEATRDGCPPGLAAAVRHAVFPGGARIRPKLCLAVADALGNPDPELAAAAAAAIELLHCASLVHDDLPCFDDAELRRGRASVHRAYGEARALLAGDALIVLAFETLGRADARDPRQVGRLVGLLGAAVGARRGLCGGQGWELEPEVCVAQYHRAKTGALFAAATEAGALAAGCPGAPWRLVGERLGEAYQVADDLRDVACSSEELGKPVGRDAALGRPSAVSLLGLDGAIARLGELVRAAMDAVPECAGASALRRHIEAESVRLVPVTLASRVA
jgi:geranylgeranyl diphosphate synthase type II